MKEKYVAREREHTHTSWRYLSNARVVVTVHPVRPSYLFNIIIARDRSFASGKKSRSFVKYDIWMLLRYRRDATRNDLRVDARTCAIARDIFRKKRRKKERKKELSWVIYSS